MKNIRQKSLFVLKIDLPAILAVLLFAGLIFFYLLPGFENAMMERKRNLIHEMTSSAYSILEYYHSLESRGLTDGDSVRFQAMTAISSIRYGDMLKDYFWITDRYPRMIIHPYRPDLNGKDLTEYSDSRGKLIFVEFVKAASASGESYVEYMWQWNDDSTRIVPKLSYVRLFEPWGWVIGTGMYIEDVRAEIRKMEMRALLISGIIGAVIVILLSVIARQSHRIEQKRSRAEEELLKSRELYRTLAEAATEGVLIWSSQGLQANKILLSWLGYTEAELHYAGVRDVFITDWSEDPADAESFYDGLTNKIYHEGNLKTKTGTLISAHADFSRILLGDLKAVLAIFKTVKTDSNPFRFPSAKKVLENIPAGLFRISYGRKNKFIYANDTTVKMLGFNTLQELVSHSVDSFFADPAQLKAFRSALETRQPVIGQVVLIRRRGGDEFIAVVNADIIESDTHELWCEGSVEPLSPSSGSLDSMPVDLGLFSASYIMDAPVHSIMKPLISCPENMSAARVSSLMKDNDIQSIVITNLRGEPMGTVDMATLGLKLAEGGKPDTEIFRWMSSPPSFINRDAKISEAFERIHNSSSHCLLVASDELHTEGMVTPADLSGAFFSTPDLIISEIDQASSPAALRTVFLRSRRLAVSMILGHADPFSVALFISSVADAIFNKAIKICIEGTGLPPCRFAFIVTGSAGRKEPSLSTDQDNAIIFENLSGEHLKEAHNYFLTLGKKVNDLLSFVGYKTCKGGNMAGNPKWCQNADRWKEYFSGWIKAPGPEELLEVSIFFDFRFCHGDPQLTDELRHFVQNDLKTNDIYFHHMTGAWKQFNPSVSQLSAGNMDIKKLLMPLTGVIRLYALKNQMRNVSTPERIVELYSGNQLDPGLMRETLEAWKVLTSIRLNHQAICVGKGSEPDNMVDFQFINPELRYLTEKAVVTINNLLLKAGSDFYTDTI